MRGALFTSLYRKKKSGETAAQAGLIVRYCYNSKNEKIAFAGFYAEATTVTPTFVYSHDIFTKFL